MHGVCMAFVFTSPLFITNLLKKRKQILGILGKLPFFVFQYSALINLLSLISMKLLSILALGAIFALTSINMYAQKYMIFPRLA